MANTPLYKALKQNGTTIYAFPGTAEDISAAYQNSNYKMYFSKYVLLNIPKQNLSTEPKCLDFNNSFSKSSNATPATTFSEEMVESLRNYVANHEIVIRESKLNNTSYYYNTNALETTTEKIFWKWCKKLNIIDFEPAIPSDEYFDNLPEFESNNINDDEYFPEYLWKEREVIDWDTITFYQSGDITYSTKLEIEFNGTTNFRVGDIMNLYNVSNTTILSETGLSASGTTDGLNLEILKVIPAGATQGQRIIVNIDSTLGSNNETTGQARLVYNKLVRYIGEVNGISNVQEANRSYTEVYANIPDHTGETPDILFRTSVDVNYKPSMTFPILPSQYQPEILGAEFFNSPIVNNPQNYPGSYFGQFDTLDFTYKTANGDSLRRSGAYYGVSGNINNVITDGSTIDGIILDFDTTHYVKMNIPNRVVTNFDQFNALYINNEAPKDFEFNAILWYYTVEDNNGNTRSNLYGISFLDNPKNNTVDGEVGIKFPSIKKLVSNGNQDGTSYSFNLNLNYNIINENPVDTYNPEAINSLFSMNLFNSAMSKLAATNDSFLNIIAEQQFIRNEIVSLKGLLYTQTDLNVINQKINNLNNLLNLYSTNQIVSSDSIVVNQIPGAPPTFMLTNNDTRYFRVDNYLTSELYDAQGIIPINISVPTNRDLLINIKNNDTVNITFQNNDRLTITLDKDLNYKQSIDINITSNELSTQNKKLDIYMVSDAGALDNIASEVLLLGNIDLPVFYNPNTQVNNSAYLWNNFDFNIDFSKAISLTQSGKIQLTFEENTYLVNNSIKTGDVLYLNNLFIGTSSNIYDYSGQYIVDSILGSTIVLDMTSNTSFVTNYQNNIGLTLHDSTSSLLYNKPYFSLNKGKNIKITRISDSDTLKDRYQIDIRNIE